MYGKFTERAQRVLLLAKEEAKKTAYPYIGTEHLLIGLILEGQGIAARVLTAVGMDADKVRVAVAQMVEAAGGQPA